MHEFILNIFPAGLDSSVVTTVWIGVAVIGFFNLRLGWVSSGIVVPGYLVPLLIVKPWSAAVVLCEALVTYVVVRGISDLFARRGVWSGLFGRDRFFALLVASILVRVVFDGWLLPAAGEYLDRQYHVAFDYQNNLHSYGLIIVSLIANQFWKSGLARGLLPFAVTVGATYAVVRFGLMEYTNFTISNLGYMYEDIASSILASPKAYIVLLTTAFMASRMNLRYGWEFNGILIPSLVSLLWYNPGKIVSTFAESVVIMLLSELILRTPLFKTMSVEGMRKIVLFFNVSYVYKFLLAYLVLWKMPHERATDFWGFGYLLPTLLAIKMHDTEAALRTMRVTVQTSFVSVAAASVLGFALTFLPGLLPRGVPEGAGTLGAAMPASSRSLIEEIRDAKVPLYRGRRTAGFRQPTPAEVNTFLAGAREILAYAEGGDEKHLRAARALLREVQYRVSRIEDRYLLLAEEGDYRGWGIYVFDLKAASRGMVVEIPAPLDEWGSVEAGAWLFKAMRGRALAIAGASRTVNPDRSSDALGNYNTIYNMFHREFGGHNVLQVRTFTAESARVLSGSRPGASELGLPEMPSMLWVASDLPPGLYLPVLKDLVQEFRVEWGRTPLQNMQRDTAGGGFAELILDKRDVRKILARSAASVIGYQVTSADQRIDGYLQDWLLKSRSELADRGTELYRRPRLEDMLYLDEEVLTPLIRVARHEYRAGEFTKRGSDDLHILSVAASALGFRIIKYHHTASGQDYLILAERPETAVRRHWGTFVIRLGTPSSFIVQIPRPVLEVNSFEYGVALFERLRAEALFIAGAHPLVNADGSGDMARADNKMSAFNLACQVLLRESGNNPVMIIQSRAFGIRTDVPFPRTDALLALSSGATQRAALGGYGRQVADMLEAEGFSYRFVDGSPETAGYEVGTVPPALYLNQSQKKEFMILWLSPLARRTFSQKHEDTWEEVFFRTLRMQTAEEDLVQSILHSPAGDAAAVPPAVRAALQKYLQTHDVIVLKRLRDASGDCRLRRVIDINTKQSFLLVSAAGGRLLLVANLDPKLPGKTYVLPAREPEATVAEYINARAGLLEMRTRP